MSEQEKVGSVETTALALKVKADAIVIKDKPTFIAAEALYDTYHETEKTILNHHKEPKATAHAKWKKICALEKKHVSSFSEGKAILKSKMRAFTAEQQRIASELRKQQEEEARKKAEDARLADAEELDAKGEHGQADAILEAPIVPEQVAPIEVMQRKGETTRWSAKIIDFKALCQAWGEGKAPMPDLSEDQLKAICTATGLNKIATGLKANMISVYPGVEGVSKIS